MSKQKSGWLEKTLAHVQVVFNVDNRRALAMCSLASVLELDADEAYACTETSGVGDTGISGWHYDIETDQFHVVVVKWSDRTSPLGTRTIREFAEIVSPFCARGTPETHGDEESVWAALRTARQDEAATVIHLVTNSTLSQEAVSEAKRLTAALPVHPWVEVWTPARLEALQQPLPDEGMKGMTLSFRSTEPFAIVVEPPSAKERLVGRSIVVNLSGKGIAEVASHYKTQIVRANVRHHLGARNRVNRKLRATLVDPEEHQFFWYYNNGITILADDFRWSPGQCLLEIDNPQVVNGCQTVTALIDQADDIPSDVAVLAKVIKVSDDEKGARLAVAISERTNEQTPVKYSDLRSNDAVHKKLRNAFEKLNPPWYYELKRGDWNSLTRAQQLRFTSQRKLDKATVAQCWRMFNGEPMESLNVEAVFSESKLYHRVFLIDRAAEDFLLPCVVYRYWFESLSMGRFDDLKTLSPGLTEGLLDRILRARKLVAGHLTAMTKVLLVKAYGEPTGPLAAFLAHEWQSGRLVQGQRIVFSTFRAWGSEREQLKAELNKPRAIVDLRERLLDTTAMMFGDALKEQLPSWNKG